MMWQCRFCVHILVFDSRPADDPPEPERLEPVGVQRREVDDRVGPDRDADERPAPPLVIRARRVRLLVLERLLDGGLGERVLLVGSIASGGFSERSFESSACEADSLSRKHARPWPKPNLGVNITHWSGDITRARSTLVC